MFFYNSLPQVVKQGIKLVLITTFCLWGREVKITNGVLVGKSDIQIFTYFDEKTVHHQPKLPVPIIMRYCGRYTPFIASVCVSVYQQKIHFPH